MEHTLACPKLFSGYIISNLFAIDLKNFLQALGKHYSTAVRSELSRLTLDANVVCNGSASRVVAKF